MSQRYLAAHILSVGELLKLAGTVFLLGCLFLSLSFWLINSQKPLRFFGGVIVGVGLLGLVLVGVRHSLDHPLGTVIDSEREVFASPSETNNVVVFKIHEGMIVKVIEKQVDWVSIELEDAKRGWIPAKSLKF